MARVNTTAIDAAFDAIDEEPAVVEETEEEVVEDEPSDVVEEEVEEEEEVEQEVVDHSAPEIYRWSGNPDDLPEKPVLVDGVEYDLRTTLKQMQAGQTKRAQSDAELRRQYEASIAQVNEFLANQKKVVDDPRPSNPMSDWNEDDANKRWDEIQQWNARQERRKAMESGEIPDPSRFNDLVATHEKEMAAQRRISWLTSQPDYAKLEKALLSAVDSSEYWQEQIQTDGGTQELYRIVKLQVEADELRSKAAELESAKIRRAAGSGARATPKPSSRKAAIDTFAESLKDLTPKQKIDRIIDDAEF